MEIFFLSHLRDLQIIAYKYDSAHAHNRLAEFSCKYDTTHA